MSSSNSNTFNDIDINIDWLYRGRKKNKPRLISNNNTVITENKNLHSTQRELDTKHKDTSSGTSSTRPRSSSVSNALLGKNIVLSNINNSNPTLESSTILNPNNLTTKKSNESNLKISSVNTSPKGISKVNDSLNSTPTRSRSNSISLTSSLFSPNATNANRTADKKSNANATKDNSSEKKKSRTSSVSSNDKPKKSLLSSIFRRSSIASPSPTPPRNASNTTANLNTAIEVTPPISTAMENYASNNVNNIPITPKTHNSGNTFDDYTMNFGSPDFKTLTSSRSSPYLDSPLAASTSPVQNFIVNRENNESFNSQATTNIHVSSADKEDIYKLKKIKLKRINFAIDKCDSDPPQQLPSRKPKIGNVLIPDDMISDIPNISIGITNSIDSKLRKQSKRVTKESKEYMIALENYEAALREAAKHQQAAHKAAERMAKEVKNFKFTKDISGNGNNLAKVNSLVRKISNTLSDDTEGDEKKGEDRINNENSANEIDVNISHDVSKINIDKPLHQHESFSDTYANSYNDNDSSKEATLDIIYTRCCHLREILPITSTLKQLKGKTAPLQVLKFLNPRPTLIDILSFCDFVSITPICTVVFDNVILNSEMLHIVLSSLAYSKTLDKLGLRNVVINRDDWYFFCKFLLKNKSITKLDISQTKTRSDLQLSDYRESMNWNLFSYVLHSRKGKPLEELLLNGLKLKLIPLPVLRGMLTIFSDKYNKTNDVIENISRGRNNYLGVKLGVASTDVPEDYLVMLFDWMSKSKVQGVDLSYNHLNPYLKLMAKKLARHDYDNLQYFSFNNTAVSDVQNFALLLKYLSKLPNVRFLDVSNIPELFPHAIPFFFKYLPRFPNLKRIHIDNNLLSFRQLIMMCNILTKCQNLSNISIINGDSPELEATNNAESHGQVHCDTKGKHKIFSKNTVWAAFYSLVRDSPNLFTLDVEYDQIPEEIQSRIAICLMRNMQKSMDEDFKVDRLSKQDQLLFDGSLISETADEVLRKLENDNEDDERIIAARKYILKKFLERLDRILKNVQETISTLSQNGEEDELPSKEKENLLRLMLLEKNLNKIMEIFAALPAVMDNVSSSTDGKTTGYSRPFLKTLDSARLMQQVISDDNDVEASKPHVVAESGDKIIDVDTGNLILYKSPSSTSIANRKQEEEEGELHKWGFFVQQRKQLYPSDSDVVFGKNENSVSSAPSFTSNVEGNHEKEKTDPHKFLQRIPSGDELRKTIISAKGTATIDELIRNISKGDDELDRIYNAAYFLSEKDPEKKT